MLACAKLAGELSWSVCEVGLRIVRGVGGDVDGAERGRAGGAGGAVLPASCLVWFGPLVDVGIRQWSPRPNCECECRSTIEM